jgi:hypothetical protein
MEWSDGESLHLARFPHKSTVLGHLISPSFSGPIPLGRHEIRVAGRTDQGSVATFDFRDLLAQKAGSTQTFLPWQVGRHEVEHHQQTALPSGPSAVLPKDHSLKVSSVEFSLCSKTGLRYFQQLSEIGQIEGFNVVGLTSEPTAKVDQELKAEGYKNYALYQSEVSHPWLEDTSESLEDGTRLASSRFSGLRDWTEGVLQAGREKRLGALAVGIPNYLGKVNETKSQKMAAAQALLHSQPVRQANTYFEGGNILPGRRQDGSAYVLVGQDTLELAASVLAEERGARPSPEEVKAAMAHDLGVDASQLFPVEQPGSFHLDMRMMPIGPGRIALQDSREAVAQHLQWLRDDDQASEHSIAATEARLNDWADACAPLEDIAARDLEAAGLEVCRIAGAFPSIQSPNTDGANFFNARHGVSPEGSSYSIMMGGPAQAESYVARKLLMELNCPIDRLYFLDPEETPTTLREMGGLKCRSKLQGVLSWLQKPTALPSAPVNAAVQLSLF